MSCLHSHSIRHELYVVWDRFCHPIAPKLCAVVVLILLTPTPAFCPQTVGDSIASDTMALEVYAVQPIQKCVAHWASRIGSSDEIECMWVK